MHMSGVLQDSVLCRGVNVISIRENSGDYGLDISDGKLEDVVHNIRSLGGYVTLDYKGRKVFVPWHSIDFIMEDKENSAEVP